jgi:pimeloyl-ACP methyl ester carboxylesterase
VIHGDDDAVRSHEQGVALAEATGGELVTIAGGGHTLPLRDPVVVNYLIERFVERVAR